MATLIPELESIEDDGDLHAGKHFDYLISNPPFGVNWSDYKSDALKLATSRYRWGTPDVGDGAFLFLLTMIEKMKPVNEQGEGGSKIAILFNGSPLSNGDALSGGSEIRRHILENDLLDCIVMLPDQMFYNTPIYTYIWILSNNKPAHKQGKVLIINAREQFEKEPKSFGNKRNRISDKHRAWIDQQYNDWQANEHCKLFATTDFAFHKVAVVFWQEDENYLPMWIREAFDIQLNNGNVKKKYQLYGDMTFYIRLSDPQISIDGEETTLETITLEQHYDETEESNKPFETLIAEQLKAQIPQLATLTLNEIKKWFKTQEKETEYHHRHYIEDNEYIPFDANQPDKTAHINQFLADEIDYPIIRWQEVEQLGYEILPNKYFYKYIEPTPSDELIKEFWQLEEQAKKLLDEIKAL